MSSGGTPYRAIVQLSAALALGAHPPPSEASRWAENRNVPTPSEVAHRRKQLARWFAPDTGPTKFALQPLYALLDTPPHETTAPASSLRSLSRHGSYVPGRCKHSMPQIPAIFRITDRVAGTEDQTGEADATDTPADALPEIGTGGPARMVAQRPLGMTTSAHVEHLDHNDYLVVRTLNCPPGCSEEPLVASLDEARTFLALLYSLRRSTTFTERLAERMYHVWLPPLLLEPDSAGTDLGAWAMFPFVGLTRQTNSQNWRSTFTFNVVLAPAEIATTLSPRSARGKEIAAIVSSLDGPVANPWQGPCTAVDFTDRAGCAAPYLASILDVAPACDPQPLWNRTGGNPLREWMEIHFFAVSRRQRSNVQDPPSRERLDLANLQGNEARNANGLIADEVVRSLRTTSCWSIVTSDPKMDPTIREHTRKHAPRDDGAWTDVAAYERLGALFTALSKTSRATRGFFPSVDDRVDQGRIGEVTSMTWVPPWKRCVVRTTATRAENFPKHSWLNGLVSWGFMTAGLMTAREIMFQLEYEAELSQRNDGERISNQQGYVLDLEEMYDLEISWTFHRKSYARARHLFGLDEMYAGIAQKADVLGRYRAKLDSLRREERVEFEHEREVDDRKQDRAINTAAGLLALAILFITSADVALAGTGQEKTFLAHVTVAIALSAIGSVILAFMLLRGHVRRLRQEGRTDVLVRFVDLFRNGPRPGR